MERPDRQACRAGFECNAPKGKDLIAATALTPEGYNGAILPTRDGTMQTKNLPL